MTRNNKVQLDPNSSKVG